MSKRIFLSDEHQKIFDRQGFIVVPFLEAKEICILNQYFDELHPDTGQSGFYSGSYSNDYQYKKNASDKIVKVFTRAYQKYFTDYQPFGAAFLYKVPGVNSELAVHQDWTIVDEEENVALNCWVPLTNIDETNGALHIVPGTHYEQTRTLRAPTIPFFFSGNDEIVEQASVPIYVRAGEAVILNQSVVHYSVPNRSTHVRKAITAGVKSAHAQMYFHYKVPEKNELEVFAMDDDFLISFRDFATDIHQRPYLGKSVGYKLYQSPVLSRNDLISTIENITQNAGFPYTYPKTKKSIFEKIASFWK